MANMLDNQIFFAAITAVSCFLIQAAEMRAQTPRPSGAEKVKTIVYHFPDVADIGTLSIKRQNGSNNRMALRMQSLLENLAPARGEVKLSLHPDQQIIFVPGKALYTKPQLIDQIDPTNIKAITFGFRSGGDSEDTIAEKLISRFGRFKYLTRLDLAECDVTSKSFAQAARGLPALEWLSLSRSAANKDCLASVGLFKNLVWFNLHDCDMRGSDLTPLASLTKLQAVDLSGALIGDSQIAQLARNTSITGLNLSNNRGITDRSIKALQGMKSLLSVEDSKTAMTKAGAEALRQRPNGCKLKVVRAEGKSAVAPPSQDEMETFAPLRY